jgi:hypothetical protein
MILATDFRTIFRTIGRIEHFLQAPSKRASLVLGEASNPPGRTSLLAPARAITLTISGVGRTSEALRNINQGAVSPGSAPDMAQRHW